MASNVKDTLSRLNGVGDVQLSAHSIAMRIWLDADLLNKYKLTPVDVINQLKVQNDQIAAGQLGGTPALPGATIERLDYCSDAVKIRRIRQSDPARKQ
ncbi:efflux RND transporter permease subunit [Escherichia coli]|uniref:efflux RND transporter permease subunit n=1 Tax=Escherichia coli TaxID=562 RepID=UPI000B0A7FDF|nr:efflux RND transporter permease subunit [Escherichia coli]